MTTDELTSDETVTAADRGLETEEFEGRILEFIRDRLLSAGTTVGRDDDLLSGNLLDSIHVVRLAAFVEEELQVPMQPADFVIENFQSVAVLAEYVRRAGRRPDADSGR